MPASNPGAVTLWPVPLLVLSCAIKGQHSEWPRALQSEQIPC